MKIQEDFVSNFDLKRSPHLPEPFYDDYEFRLEENCPVCNLQLGFHTEDEIILCVLNEKGVEPPKG